jgi:hypothetical protein
MPLSTNFVAALHPMHPKEVFEVFLNGPKDIRSTLDIVNEVRPADLFCYLAARFGRPNGVQNALRSNDSDNLIHWDWTLRHEQGVIIFLGMNFRTEVHIMGLAPSEDHKRDLVEQLKNDFPNHGAKMGAVRKQLEQWTEFVNPYQRIRRSVERLLTELDHLNLDPDTDRFDPFGSDAPGDELSKRWGDLSERYSKGFGLCFGIRSMLPVMAEAFVNLMLYVLMRPEIRGDQRLFDNAFRQPIDVRIRSLSINCMGFKQQPDYASEPCRTYHTLVNERNDLLHGNVVVDKLKFNEVYFLGKVPVFKEYRSVWERSLQVEIDTVGLQAVRAELTTVDGLIAYLLSCLDEKLREPIELMMNRHELGRNEQTGRTGVLFPEWLVDMRAGPSAPRDSEQS